MELADSLSVAKLKARVRVMAQNNRSRDVEDQAMCKHIEEIVSEIIHD